MAASEFEQEPTPQTTATIENRSIVMLSESSTRQLDDKQRGHSSQMVDALNNITHLQD